MSEYKKQFNLNGDILTVIFNDETKDFEASISVKGIKPKISEVKKDDIKEDLNRDESERGDKGLLI